MARPSGLGRGLSALLEDGEAPSGAGIRTLPIDRISANPEQPRRHFDETALEELAASISERGVLQPILVRPAGDGYEIIAGERRWRAAQKAQLHEIPAIVRETSDAVEAIGQDVDQVSADELICCKSHDLHPIPALDPVVFPAERHGARIGANEAAV